MNRTILFLAVVAALAAVSCGRSSRGDKGGNVTAVTVTDKGFSRYISAYTTGVVPVGSTVQIVLTPEFAAQASKGKTQGLFTFEPAIRGEAEWVDDLTLVFRPSAPLKPSTAYSGRLDLGKTGVTEEKYRYFPLSFRTVEKNFTVTVSPLTAEAPEGKSYTLTGTVETSDVTDPQEVEKYITVTLGRQEPDLSWEHGDGNTHTFTVTGIERHDREREVTVAWNGNSYGAKNRGEVAVSVPKAGLFTVTAMKVTPGENSSADLWFSDILDASGELDGLVTLSPSVPLTLRADGNRLTVIPEGVVTGEVTLTVDAALRNSSGARLGKPFTANISFSPVEPGLRSAGKGTIMPASGSLVFPFLAANLSAVDLTVIKIFENNLPYFLQQNSMGEANPYNNVTQFGRPVYRGRIDLTTMPGFDPGRYSLYSIDLADFITPEKGILYRIELGMRPSYSLYPCSGERKPSGYEEMLSQADLDREWEGSDDYYRLSEEGLFYEYAYNWRERENPCSDAFFSPDKKLVCNVLASDLGIMAKSGAGNSLHLFVNDLTTAAPVEGATAEVYDYQMQLTGSGTTDKYGMAVVSCERKPFLVIARKNDNRNYLSLSDGSSLSMSSFDVSGESPQEGIRAFLFNERDVRRPGDTIFTGVIVRDVTGSLPAGHPVQFELFNPLGQRVDEQVAQLDERNFITFTSVTSPDAVTGNYRAQVRIGGATFTKTVKVETVKPNRLKIKLDFPYTVAGGEESGFRGSMKASWLSGATARDMKATVELLLKPVRTTFEKYGQYCFDDPAAQFFFDSRQIFDGTVNSSGEASFSFTPGDELSAPGMLDAVITARVFEKGGDASITQTTLPYAPYPAFVGMNIPALGQKGRILYTDKPNEIRVVTVDKNGKPVRSEVEVNIYKLEYRWWWESDDEYLGSYISRSRNTAVFSEMVTTSGGEAKVTFTAAKEQWGRYLVRATLPSGHSAGLIVLVDWPWEYGMKPGGNDGASMLQLNTDREKYAAGDEISLSFPSPDNGQAIVTIENGSGILDIAHVRTKAGDTRVKIKATPEMAPNAYLYVTLLQPHAQTVNDAPIRLYGVIPVMVEDPSTRLTPVITVPDRIRSQQETVIRVSEQHKRGMTYTLAVVDEGLLDLTGFRTPDPWKWYYARQALGVRTWDLYDIVFGAFGARLGSLFSVGGDEAVVDQSKNRARRFTPVVRFLGPYTLAPGRTASHTLKLPQYTGSVRVMVVAAGDGNNFGSAEKSVAVSDPLMILATAPRVLSPGDRVTLPVTVFAEKGVGDVTVTASGNELVSFTVPSATVSLSSAGEKDAALEFTTAASTGRAVIHVTATAGSETASYDLELEVRSPNPPERRSETRRLDPGQSFEKSFEPFGMGNTPAASLEIFTLPATGLERRLGWLTSYSYGCTEQVTSAAFPQVYLPDLLGRSLPDPGKVRGNVQEALRTVASRQLPGGALTLWPGGAYPDDWVTSYAGHFAIEARKAGYAVPQSFTDRWLAYQRSAAASWKYQPQYRYTANDQAYRLFTMALAGSPDKGAMNRMREITDLPALARWLLAAAYATTGRPEAAQELTDVRNLSADSELEQYNYGSSLRDKSIILYTLTLTGHTEEALGLLRETAAEMSGETWYSTQTTAWALFAYMNFSRTLDGSGDKKAAAAVTVNGKGETLTMDRGAVIRRFTPERTNSLRIENTGEKTLFVTFTEEGVPSQADVTTAESNISIKADYTDMSMNAVDIRSLPQGTGFIMNVTVTNTSFRRLDNLALTQMVPSGWEIQNTRLFEASLQAKESGYDHRDFRDDRVYTFFGLKAGETKHFSIILTASYKGVYSLPAVTCEAMYDAGVHARRPGGGVSVTEAQ